MRILLASDHFPPFIGGAHRWAGLMASGLAHRGHEVVVATAWHGGHARLEHYDDGRVPVHRVRQLRTPIPALVRGTQQRHIPPYPDPLTIRDLRGVIRQAQPAVVLSHGWIGFSMVRALKNSEIPIALSAHDYSYFCATRRLLYRGKDFCSGPALAKCVNCSSEYYGPVKGTMAVAGVFPSRRLTERRIQGLQSVTSFVDEALARHLIRSPSAKARVRRYVIPPFVDVDPAGTEAERRQVAEFVEKLPEEPFIMYAGAFRLDKGLEVLFDAYHRLENPPPLVLMGTMERDTPPLPESAIVLKDVPHAAVMEGWRRALLGVAPSLLPEPLGTVTVEGITHGVPMIATVPSGMVDVLGDGVGILVPQRDPGALAAAMQSLIDDPARRAALSRRGKARSVAFQAEVVLSRYEQMLEELVAG
jgi:glycosyltransferase involved in cell wall biosynthesis